MSDYFPWRDELALGIDEIDAQHRLLVDIINRVYAALIGRLSRPEAGRILEELVQYTAVHFAVEESLFRITDYPDYEAHKARHEHLKNEVLLIKRGFDLGHLQLDLGLMNFLKSWLENHILGEDRAYVQHLLASGIKARWSRSGWVGRIWSSLRAP